MMNYLKKLMLFRLLIIQLKTITDTFQKHFMIMIVVASTKRFNNLTSENFPSRLVQANLASKNDIANFALTDFDDKLKDLNKKITSNKTRYILVKNQLKKLQAFGSTLFYRSKLPNDGAQLYLILQPLYYTEKVLSRKSKRLLTKKCNTPTTTDNSLFPSVKWYENSNLRFILCFIFTPPNTINFFNIYDIQSKN